MDANQWVRQIHRWLSIAFTAGVVTYIIVMSTGHGEPAPWIGLLALVPLILLLCSGLYLFALPYVGTRRSRGRA